MPQDSRGFIDAMVDDGRPLISFTGLCLALSGAFALFQSATGHFLPHDTAFLQMVPEDLCRINECRIVHFMFHDRVSFGGALIAIAVLYLWIAAFPMSAGEAWAWWALLLSGLVGFGSFLTYLGYGYLDSWHGAATMALLPCFTGGLWKSRRSIKTLMRFPVQEIFLGSFLKRVAITRWWSRLGIGYLCLFAAAIGMIGAGLTIQMIGMTAVFVPTDLVYMGLDREQLSAINPRLIPLIAHDRAGFGGAIATVGVLVFACLWCGRPSRAMWQALVIAGIAGWTTAIFVHPIIGYIDAGHLAPAVIGAFLYSNGLILTSERMRNRVESQ